MYKNLTNNITQYTVVKIKFVNIIRTLRTEIRVRSKYFTKESIQGFAISKIREDVGLIPTVKYANDLVLMAKKETVLQGMTDKLTEDGRCNGM